MTTTPSTVTTARSTEEPRTITEPPGGVVSPASGYTGTFPLLIASDINAGLSRLRSHPTRTSVSYTYTAILCSEELIVKTIFY